MQSSAPDRQGQIEFTGARLRHHALEAEANAASPKNAEHSPKRRGLLRQAPELPTAITARKEGMLMPAATDMQLFPNGTTLSLTASGSRASYTCWQEDDRILQLNPPRLKPLITEELRA